MDLNAVKAETHLPSKQLNLIEEEQHHHEHSKNDSGNITDNWMIGDGPGGK